MQRNKQHIEGFNLLFIFIVLGAMMAMLVGCKPRYPELFDNFESNIIKDTAVSINRFSSGGMVIVYNNYKVFFDKNNHEKFVEDKPMVCLVTDTAGNQMLVHEYDAPYQTMVNQYNKYIK